MTAGNLRESRKSRIVKVSFRTSLSQMTEDTRSGDNSQHDNDDYQRGVDIVKRCSGNGKIAVDEVDRVAHISWIETTLPLMLVSSSTSC